MLVQCWPTGHSLPTLINTIKILITPQYVLLSMTSSYSTRCICPTFYLISLKKYPICSSNLKAEYLVSPLHICHFPSVPITAIRNTRHLAVQAKTLEVFMFDLPHSVLILILSISKFCCLYTQNMTWIWQLLTILTPVRHHQVQSTTLTLPH